MNALNITSPAAAVNAAATPVKISVRHQPDGGAGGGESAVMRDGWIPGNVSSGLRERTFGFCSQPSTLSSQLDCSRSLTRRKVRTRAPAARAVFDDVVRSLLHL